jgi:hypothetical protein
MHGFVDSSFAEISTSTIDIGDESRGRPVQKAKVSLWHLLLPC